MLTPFELIQAQWEEDPAMFTRLQLGDLLDEAINKGVALEAWASKAIDYILNHPCTCENGDCKYCLDADDLLIASEKFGFTRTRK